MILTVTLNSAVDRVLVVDCFRPDGDMQARKIVTSVGGKGLDTSVVLRTLGEETVGLAFVAGEEGRLLLDLLNKYGIQPAPVWVGGCTRTCYVIAEMDNGRVSHIKDGELHVQAEQIEQLKQLFELHVQQASWAIFAGSVPQSVPDGLYGELIRSAQKYGVRALVDSSRAPVLEAIRCRPAIVKMNRDEFAATFQIQRGEMEPLLRVGRAIYEKYQLENLVLTLGAQGILAYTPEGIYQAAAPEQLVVNAAGAGDAVSAALASQLSQGSAWRQALHWAAAAAAATVLTEGTADCNEADILRIYPEVLVHPVEIP